MAISRKSLLGLGAGVALLGGLGFAVAAPGDGPGGHGWMHAKMHGGKHGERGQWGERFCASDQTFAPRIAERLEGTIRPTEAQKPEFDALKAAMEKAETGMKAACPTQAERDDRTPPGRLALAEKRMSAGLDAIRTVRPAFDALYAKLDDTQRDRLRWVRGGGMMGFGMHGRG